MNAILIDARESGSTTGRYIDNLLLNIFSIDKNNKYKILTKPERARYFRGLGGSFDLVSADVKEFTLAEQLSLDKIIEKNKPNLVHFGMTQQPVFYKGRSVTTIHDLTTLRFNNPDKNILIFKFKQLVYRFVVKRVAKKSRYIITPSEYVKKDLVSYTRISPDKVIVTHEAADKIKDIPSVVDSLSSKKFLMYTGRPTPHKNLNRLIEAHQKLLDKRPDLYLALSGKIDANYLRIKAWVEKNNYKNVVFTNFVSEGQLRWMYENARCYVFPSLSEGFGLPGLEAMVHGCPVVSSNYTCLPEIYGDAPVYFNPTSVNDMANAIGFVLDDDKLRTQMIKKGKLQASKYSWKRMAEQTLEVYKKALS